MARYRRKPTVVQAEQWFPGKDVPGVRITEAGAIVFGKQGAVRVDPGDWIVSELDGTGHSPVKPAVFAATYEPAP